MSFKRVIFWTHLAVGLVFGLILFMMALTGFLMAFETEIKGLFSPSVEPSLEHAEMMSADDLLKLSQSVFTDETVTLDYFSDETKPLAVKAGRHELKLLNPYTGKFIEQEEGVLDEAFEGIEYMHKTLAMGFGSPGQGAIRASSLAFLFLIISGIYLWFPKKWKWPFLRARVLFIRGLPTAKARDFNWHHVFSFWALIPIIVVVGTGVLLSYNWANQVVFDVAGVSVPGGGGGGKGQGKGMWARRTGGGDSSLPVEQLISYQEIMDKARQLEPDWKTLSIILPNSNRAQNVDILIDSGNGKQVAEQKTVTFSRETGEKVKELGPNEMTNESQRLKRFIRFLHSGEVFGLWGQALAAFAALATMFLVWTGFALSWRRLISPLFSK